MDILDNIKNQTIMGGVREIEDLVNHAVSDGLSPDDILNKSFISAMEIMDKNFRTKSIFPRCY
jgi:methanogenic corrinoid protein MtbC1